MPIPKKSKSSDVKDEPIDDDIILQFNYLAAPNVIHGNKRPRPGRNYSFRCESFDGRVAKFKLIQQ